MENAAESTRTVYEAVGGDEGVLRLAEAWHARVMADAVVSHAFSHGFDPAHTERLAAYWTEAWGGPAVYSEKATTTTMARYPHDAAEVPEGLHLPHWSWDGLV